MHPLLVLNVVGLTPELVGANTPNIARLVQRGGMRPLHTVTPAVTCSVQATFLTGLPPGGHGAVANGWLFRDLHEIWLWRQSNRLLGGERVWDAALVLIGAASFAAEWLYRRWTGRKISALARRTM